MEPEFEEESELRPESMLGTHKSLERYKLPVFYVYTYMEIYADTYMEIEQYTYMEICADTYMEIEQYTYMEICADT